MDPGGPGVEVRGPGAGSLGGLGAEHPGAEGVLGAEEGVLGGLGAERGVLGAASWDLLPGQAQVTGGTAGKQEIEQGLHSNVVKEKNTNKSALILLDCSGPTHPI